MAVTADDRALALLRQSRAGRALAWAAVAAIALLWAAITWELGRDRSRAVREAEAATANLARAFEEHFLRTVAGLDQVLLRLKAEYERAPAAFGLGAATAAASSILGQVAVQIARIDADGVLADSSVPDFPRVDLSDREHFRVHQSGATNGLSVSKPVLDRASGRWSIQLTRRLNGPGGAFAGVMVLSLDPHYLAGFYGSFDIGPGGAVLLVGRDGVVRADSSAMWVGERIAEPDLVAGLFAGRSGGTVLAGPLDGIRRVASFRTVDGLPLAVMVGRSESDTLAAHRATARTYVLAGLVLSVLLVGAVAALCRLVHRQERIAADLIAKDAELAANRERLKRYVADLERVAEVSAHDLQEPLRRVVSYTQLLSDHVGNGLDDEGRGYAAEVVEGARRIRELVQDLESFVAVDHLPPVMTLAGAEEAMATAARRLAGRVEAAGATVVISPLPRVAADPRSLAEIFTQLLDNALRYRSPGCRPVVQVTARQDGVHAVFGVRDNGIGIEPRHWGRIFEVFHRLHGVDEHPGTGIGLAIVRRMVERFGGRIWVESEPGRGATFWFTLPTVLGTAGRTNLDQEVQAA